jgi:hypothetical protein
MDQRIRSVLLSALAVVMLLFIFGPVLGLRETGSQARSRRIHEEHERRTRETLEASERDAKRSRDELERARKQLFGDR